MGQRKPVRVFQLIAEDTIESKVLDIRECCFVTRRFAHLSFHIWRELTKAEKKKDDLVAKAFEKSSKESKKDKREARFDEIKALFGIEGAEAGVRASGSGSRSR